MWPFLSRRGYITLWAWAITIYGKPIPSHVKNKNKIINKKGRLEVGFTIALLQLFVFFFSFVSLCVYRRHR